MKKKWMMMVVGLALAGMMTGCGQTKNDVENSNVKDEQNTVVSLESQVDVENELDMGIMEISDGNFAWNAEEIYVSSEKIGYLSGFDLAPGQMALIDGAEALAMAKEKLNFAKAEDNAQSAYVALAQAFQSMEQQYPAEQYAYFMMYRIVTSGGYDLKVSGLKAINGEIDFELSDDSVVPDPDEMTIDVMDGFIFLAAVDRDRLSGAKLTNVWEPVEGKKEIELTKVFTPTKEPSNYEYSDYNGKTYIKNSVLFRLDDTATDDEINKMMANDMMILIGEVNRKDYWVSFHTEKSEDELREIIAGLENLPFVEEATLFYAGEASPIE